MLTETFIASTNGTGKKNANNTSLPKDAGVFLHDFQPSAALKGAFNKSSTAASCLAVTATHVFAAQSDAAIVKVFSRERGNLETFVPLREHVSSLACVGPDDGAAVLVLGTGQGKSAGPEAGGGRIMLWELGTGRLVQTPPSHIQPVTCLAVDVTGSFLLSGSADSQIHVWSVPALLSFTELDEAEEHTRTAPVRTLSNHDGAITALATGHSHMPVDIAISASDDRRCNVWDYRTGALLHTFLMPDTPLCLALDPADRGFYAGLASGAVQMVDFHTPFRGVHPLYDRKLALVPTEPAKSDRWTITGSQQGPVCSIDVSYDGTTVLAGHQTGAVYAWDVGAPQNPTLVVNLAHPVTNLTILPPAGFPAQSSVKSRLNKSGTRLPTVVKPRPDVAVARSGASGLYAPPRYSLTACFEHGLPVARYADDDGNDTLMAEFEHFTAPGNPDLPEELWEQALAQLAANDGRLTSGQGPDVAAAVAGGASVGESAEQQNEIQRLKAQLSISQKQQKAMVAKLARVSDELEQRDLPAAKKGRKRG